MLANPAPLVAVGQILAERGAYGLAWLGDDLVVEATYGRLADFIIIGEPVTDTLYALVGLEGEIRGLRDRPEEIIDLPDIALVSASGARPRTNLSIFWSTLDRKFVVLIARMGAQSNLEMDLVRQMRARLIAEAEVSAKSRALEKANAELARANADLESFASIISHDLQSPMRALRYKVDDLEVALSADATGKIKSLLQDLRAQSRRMAGMLTALLDYSAVTRKIDAAEPVDTRRLIHAIVASLRVPDAFRVTIKGDWPAMETLAAPLDLVLRNLIDNALKHHDRTQGEIAVDARVEADWVVFTVADDGPGIAREHQSAIFLPFRRLELQQGVPGHGMGLALVRRTIEGLGGQILVESDAARARGTVFTIRWPIVLNAQ